MRKTQFTQRKIIWKITNQITAFALAFALAFLGFGFVVAPSEAQAQTTRRVNDQQVERIIQNVERRSDAFRRSFDAALDRSRFDGTYNEDLANDYVKNYETATNNLRSRFDDRMTATAEVEEVLNRAAEIDRFMQSYLRRQRRAQSDWALLKRDLERLATAYNVSFDLMGRFAPPSIAATQTPYRVSDAQVQYLLNRIEAQSDTFHRNLDTALDRSRFNETNREENINSFLEDFENATDMLKKKFDGKTSVGADVSGVLVRAARIDDFMRRNLRRERTAQRDWTSLRADLNQLANYYNLAFNLDNRRDMPAYSPLNPNEMMTNADARFTGTYRLNTNQSDNARTVAGRATSSLNRQRRDRIFNNLVRRLEAPEMLAVMRQGMRVMLASTSSPQVSLDADGMLRNETYPNGRASQVRATLAGDTLTVVSNGDRANDFTAIFTALDDGRRMLVTRRVFAEGLSQYVEVRSYYDRTAETAQFNIYNNQMTTGAMNMNDSFIVPNDTILTATLNQNLSTGAAQNGDRFTMTVNAPSPYAGAMIEGYVSNVNRSSRVAGRSEMTLNYETIRLTNNQTYRFAGLTETVTNNTSGDSVQIDREGAVETDRSRTRTTVERTAIGTGIGAILGAVLGGGKGALIGAGIGAGAGAGSVYVQGRDDLNLTSGAQFTIRAAAPQTF